MNANRKSRRALGAAAALAAAVAIGPGPATAVDAAGAAPVARVGDREILLADLEGYLRMRPAEPGAAGAEDAVRGRLEELVVSEALYAEALRRGVDREPDVRQTIRQVVVQRLLEREVDRPAFERAIGDEEIGRYYEAHRGDYVRPEQARAADVFLAAPAAGDPAVREAKRRRAESLLAEALKLQDTRFGFGELVLANSDQPEGRPKGDTGFFDREGGPGVPRELAQAVFAVGRPGALAGAVVATPAGFHVAMLTGRRAALSRPLEEPAVRREVEERIRTEERRRLHDEFLKRVRGAAAVSVDETALGGLLAAARAAAQKTGATGGAAAPPVGGQSQAPPPVPEAGR